MKKLMLFAVMVLLLSVPALMLAGNLDSPGNIGENSSAMYTLLDIFNLLDSGTEAVKSDPFDEPAAAPAGTGKTFDDIYEKVRTTARVPESGQTTSYTTTDGEDGDLQKGVPWPSTRFTDNSDGTITDNLTGLIWLKQANYNNVSGTTGATNWENALAFCNALADGSCGLSDGSSAGDWRLPNRKELKSLIDYRHYDPALPAGHPFVSVQSSYYWSSSTYVSNTSYAWYVRLNVGGVRYSNKTSNNYVWPVRGGQ